MFLKLYILNIFSRKHFPLTKQYDMIELTDYLFAVLKFVSKVGCAD